MSFLPDRKGAGEKLAPLVGEHEDAAAAVVRVMGDFDEATALERFQGGGERRAIHGEQGSDRAHRWRFGAVEGHEKRELPIGEVEGPEGFVEAPGENSRGTLHVEAETVVADHQSCLVGQRFST